MGVSEARLTRLVAQALVALGLHRGFVVHGAEYLTEDSLIRKNGVAVTASIGVLQALAQGSGPKEGMLVLGYSGWSPGQLESEIEGGSWIVVPANRHIVFEVDNETKWDAATATLGFDMGHYSTDVGHA